ncbi:DUF952 domain-containing protein [Martelella sp. HB161492]|uniref:DUF952 domain-containing protein n=1 Tax=Martelella sp. HB161492 TaxID=2720726 RepID=UPI00159045E8|nr:DUF952 domain-containing protein [Martelella sp. HB161492]
MDRVIYKIVSAAEWRAAKAAGRFDGAAIDLSDGFIHFSTESQVVETAHRHFAGKTDLLLVGVDAALLGAALKYEISRGGKPFPHLYAPLDFGAVVLERALPIGADGLHDFTGLLP